MFDSVDDDQRLGLVDLVHDAIDAASGSAHAGQLALERATESVRVVEERSKHELDNCRRDTFREPVELSFGGPGDAENVGRFRVAHLLR